MESSYGPHFRIERESGIFRVAIDRPATKNALSDPMWRSLAQMLRDFAANPDDRVFVLSGAAGCFCAGGDISGAQSGPEPAPTREEIIERTRATVSAVCLAMHEAPKPIIAAVDGVAAGAGANLAFGCDLVIASSRARFSEIFIRHGLSMDSGGTWLLPRLVGLLKAKELAFYGDWIDAAEARAIGLVNAVVEPNELDQTVQDWALRLADKSSTAIGAMKTHLNRAFDYTFPDALEIEADSLATTITSPEVRERIRQFFEKSKGREL